MTELTEKLFESHEIRKTKKQKADFRAFVTAEAERRGFSAVTEKGSLGVQNVVIGDPAKAKVVYTAHYDTCARLPFPNFITPKNIAVYILYQILLTVVMLVIPIAVAVLVKLGLDALGIDEAISFEIISRLPLPVLFIEMLLMMFGPANKHTANDNTSGVALVLDVMASLPEEEKGSAAFILFDHEELGLLGSSAYFAKHKAEMKDKLVVNFDCVSDGKNILLVIRRQAEKYRSALEASFASEGDYTCELASKGVIYPSDQASFPAGVGVAALNKTKSGMLYMNKIHTSKDIVFDEDNIEFLKNCALKLISEL